MSLSPLLYLLNMIVGKVSWIVGQIRRDISPDVSVEGNISNMIGGRSVEVDWLAVLPLEIGREIVVLVNAWIIDYRIGDRIYGSYWLFISSSLDIWHIHLSSQYNWISFYR